MRTLLRNAIQCPDGTILESLHRHDFKIHVQEDGREYFVDGGLDYQRVGYSDGEYKDLSIYTDDPHEKIRDAFTWVRVFDKDMNRLPKPESILLKDITDSHLDALIAWTEEDYPEHINQLFIAEKEYRSA